MAYLFDEFFPFNGQCSCSFGSNVALRFADGVSLYAHSVLLSLASPVLRSRLRSDGMTQLDLPNERSDVWRIILNCIYPCNAIQLLASREDVLNDALTSEVFKSCALYKLKRVLSLYDGVLACLVQRSDDCVRQPDQGEDPESMEIATTARKSVSYATEFRLPDTIKAAKRLNRDQYLKSIDECRTPPPKRPKPRRSSSPRPVVTPTRPGGPQQAENCPEQFLTPSRQCESRRPVRGALNSLSRRNELPHFSGLPPQSLTLSSQRETQRLSGRSVQSLPPSRAQVRRSSGTPLYSLNPSRRRQLEPASAIDRVQCPCCYETFEHLRRC